LPVEVRSSEGLGLGRAEGEAQIAVRQELWGLGGKPCFGEAARRGIRSAQDQATDKPENVASRTGMEHGPPEGEQAIEAKVSPLVREAPACALTTRTEHSNATKAQAS
jgi:hypothetical protein